MKTVLLCNQKGGVGKTLIADELAFALERDKIPYSFFDLDDQGSAIHTTNENPEAVVQIVDTAGALQSNLVKWIEAADFIIVPTMMHFKAADFESYMKTDPTFTPRITENFYLDGKGIHFIYDPYEIDCFGAGTIDIFVPYKF